MLMWLGIIVCAIGSAFRSRKKLALENPVLRQQLAALKHRQPRPRLTDLDRLFWVWLSRLWSGRRGSLHIVQPETVIRWHRQGFRCYWRWRSRRRGRPKLDPETRDLIRHMCRANPLWGAPRIHGKLLKPGIEISEATVSKYMIKRRGHPLRAGVASSTIMRKSLWRSIYTVPTATFKVLFVLVGLRHDRRKILHFNVTAHTTAACTGQSSRDRSSRWPVSSVARTAA
jgi:putative transposase